MMMVRTRPSPASGCCGELLSVQSLIWCSVPRCAFLSGSGSALVGHASEIELRALVRMSDALQ